MRSGLLYAPRGIRNTASIEQCDLCGTGREHETSTGERGDETRVHAHADQRERVIPSLARAHREGPPGFPVGVGAGRGRLDLGLPLRRVAVHGRGEVDRMPPWRQISGMAEVGEVLPSPADRRHTGCNATSRRSRHIAGSNRSARTSGLSGFANGQCGSRQWSVCRFSKPAMNPSMSPARPVRSRSPIMPALRPPGLRSFASMPYTQGRYIGPAGITNQPPDATDVNGGHRTT